MTRWSLNGVANALVSPADRGLSYGDGLFETIAVRQGQCRFLAAHLQRMRSGAERLQIDFPDEAELKKEISAVIADTACGTLKLTLTRGVGERGYAPPTISNPTRLISFTEAKLRKSPLGGIKVRYCATRLARNPLLAGIKSLNRLEQVMARAEWDDADIAEGLMLNDLDEVVCGTMSNVFLVREERLFTPRLDECGVSGVMRAQLMAAAANAGIDVAEVSIGQAAVREADAVFITNSLIGLWSVAQIDGQAPYGDCSLLEKLRGLLAERGVEECAP